mmetsp:Transcript_4362/g.15334  ORF Transcript_4362/g.15334 Transcript_4362/m.15334 type:complete len:289 (+) Transcript_4362:392-1258(+)
MERNGFHRIFCRRPGDGYLRPLWLLHHRQWDLSTVCHLRIEAAEPFTQVGRGHPFEGGRARGRPNRWRQGGRGGAGGWQQGDSDNVSARRRCGGRGGGGQRPSGGAHEGRWRCNWRGGRWREGGRARPCIADDWVGEAEGECGCIFEVWPAYAVGRIPLPLRQPLCALPHSDQALDPDPHRRHQRGEHCLLPGGVRLRLPRSHLSRYPVLRDWLGHSHLPHDREEAVKGASGGHAHHCGALLRQWLHLLSASLLVTELHRVPDRQFLPIRDRGSHLDVQHSADPAAGA